MEAPPFFVHPSSVVDPGAEIGEGTRIWHFCHLSGTCRVGTHCNLGQNIFIDQGVIIGNRVKIQNNVSVYNGVTIEDEVFLGPSVVFTNVLNPRSFIERKHEFRKTLVRRGATVGANATVVCGVEIGEYALVGAGAVVTRDVPAFALVTGNPARPSGWVSRAGLKLQFDPDGRANCPQTQEAYLLHNGRVTLT
ncbi:MAG TPA: acyltransferase [Chitinophagaceae bacterium]|nr:acyltransferase [Chitinophagaceae bacterium]